MFTGIYLLWLGSPWESSRITRETHFGVQYLLALAKQMGYKVGLRRPALGGEVMDLGERPLILASPYTFQAEMFERVLRQVRASYPQARVVLGGYHYGADMDLARRAIEQGFADWVVLGEGMGPFERILRGEVESPAVLESDGQGMFVGDHPWPLRFASFNRHLGEDPLTFMPDASRFGQPQNCFTLVGKMGCPFRKCGFCQTASMFPGCVQRNVEDLLNEMEYLRQEGPYVAYPVDPVFTEPRDWLEEFCEQSIRRQLRVPIIVMSDFQVERDILKLMRDAGVYYLMFGLETPFDDEREQMGKRQGDPRAVFELCLELGIHVRAFSMVAGAGWTRRSFECFEQGMIDLVKGLPVEIRITFATPLPGTALWQKAKEEPEIVADWDLSHWDTTNPVYALEDVSHDWARNWLPQLYAKLSETGTIIPL